MIQKLFWTHHIMRFVCQWTPAPLMEVLGSLQSHNTGGLNACLWPGRMHVSSPAGYMSLARAMYPARLNSCPEQDKYGRAVLVLLIDIVNFHAFLSPFYQFGNLLAPSALFLVNIAILSVSSTLPSEIFDEAVSTSLFPISCNAGPWYKYLMIWWVKMSFCIIGINFDIQHAYIQSYLKKSQCFGPSRSLTIESEKHPGTIFFATKSALDFLCFTC